jgi:hypothetical protein
VQKAIVGRLAVWTALAASEHCFGTGTEQYHKYILDTTLAFTTVEIDSRNRDRSARDFLAALEQTLLDSPDWVVATEGSTKVSECFLPELKMAIEEYSQSGPWKIKMIYEDVAATAREFYHWAGCTDVPNPFDCALFRTTFYAGRPTGREIDSQHCATATTHFSRAETPPTQVTLELHEIRKFDWPSALAIPYVLFHELICHVGQGPWNAARLESASASEFSEGWMDVIAHDVHRAAMKRNCPFAADGRYLDRSGHCREGAEYHGRRYRREDYPGAAHQRLLGANALGAVAELLEQEAGPAHSEHLWHLSAAINASGESPNASDELSGTLRLALRESDLREEAKQALLRFCEAGDVEEFMADIRQIEPKVLARYPSYF